MGESTTKPCTSMTGYGRGLRHQDSYRVSIEFKGVNHRFLEIYFRGSEIDYSLEVLLRDMVKKQIQRGRVDILLDIQREGNPSEDFQRDVFDRMFLLYRDLLREHQAETPDTIGGLILSLLNRRDVVRPEAPSGSLQMLHPVIEGAFAEGLAMFGEMRREEGERLRKDLLPRIDSLHELRERILLFRQEHQSLSQERFREKLTRLLQGEPIDDTRILQEAALWSDRSDITEEVVRFESHLAQFAKVLDQEGDGKKLDFLLQELGREITTIGAKCQNSAIQQRVVEAKSQLEKIREQTQNIE